MGARLLVAGIGLFMLTGCGPGTEGVAQVPTVMELPTQESVPADGQKAVPTTEIPTVEPTATFTLTASSVPTATLTDTPLPSPTDVPTVKPERVLEDRLTAAYETLEGVTEVHIVWVEFKDDGGFFVSLEIIVAPNFVTTDMADRLRQETYAVLASATVEFSALLYNDDEAGDFMWDNGDDAWRITTMPSPNTMDATEGS